MAALTTLAVVGGLGLAAAGAVTSYQGAKDAAKANQQQIAAYQQSEAIKREAMKFQADRERRQAIRQATILRSQALARTTAQGANQSSALPGSLGQIQGGLGFNISGVNANERFGERIFDANQQMLMAKMFEASAKSTQALGLGLSSLGGALLGNVGAIDRIGGNLSGGFSNVANYGSWSGSGFNGSGAPLSTWG